VDDRTLPSIRPTVPPPLWDRGDEYSAPPQTDTLAPRLTGNVVKRRQLPLQDIARLDPELGAPYEYWVSKRGHGLLPARKDIDILDIRPAVNITHLVNVSSEDPDDWTFLVVGPVAPRTWEWSSGRPAIRECPWPPFREMLFDDYGAARFSGAAMYHEVAARLDWIKYSYGRIILPLAKNGRKVDTLMVCINMRDVPGLEA
jgi:hypothetical protein